MFCYIRTKACKRCGGDLSLERDKYGSYVECIQCGATWSDLSLMYPNTQVASERQVVETAEGGNVSRK